MSKHTSGPWKWDDDAIRDGESLYLHSSDGGSVLGTTMNWDQPFIQFDNPANANLIAAAPDLYEACRAAKKVLHEVLGVAYDFDSLKDGPVCKECHRLSPMNEDRSTFRIVHDEECRTMARIRAELALDAAIARAEGRQA